MSLKLAIICLLVVMAGENIFLYCYFGQMASESFERFSNEYYAMPWFTLPSKHQKYFVLMIGNAQRTVYYDGSGIAKLNLNSLASVRTF